LSIIKFISNIIILDPILKKISKKYVNFTLFNQKLRQFLYLIYYYFLQK
jgi:hypothetical protein